MSPDQNNTNAVWRDSNALGWDDAGEDESLQPYDQDEVEAMFDTPAAIPDDELDRMVRPSSSRFEFLQQLGQQLSPILAPLLFGGITFLIVLPLIPKASFSPGHIAAIGLGFFAIAVLQCMMLYYAGSNNVYWTLSIIGGFFLFLLAGCFAAFGPIPILVFFIVFHHSQCYHRPLIYASGSGGFCRYCLLIWQIPPHPLSLASISSSPGNGLMPTCTHGNDNGHARSSRLPFRVMKMSILKR